MRPHLLISLVFLIYFNTLTAQTVALKGSGISLPTSESAFKIVDLGVEYYLNAHGVCNYPFRDFIKPTLLKKHIFSYHLNCGIILRRIQGINHFMQAVLFSIIN